MRKVFINDRILQHKTTGLQRYLIELLKRFPPNFITISPPFILGSKTAHAWEQFILPAKIKSGSILFSPTNTGPIYCKQQVVTIHDIVALDHPEWFSKSKGFLYKNITPPLLKNSQKIIAISEYSKNRIIANTSIDEKKIIVIPNGIDTKFGLQSETSIETMRENIKLPCTRYVLCIGTTEPRKNIARLLKAWENISKKIPDDIWLVLTGKQNQKELFSEIAGMNNLPSRVHLTGHVSDDFLPALYAGALVFAFPSLYEGFGLPPLEAMASGVPVLTGNLTSLPEVVGDAGLMVDPTDVDEIADGILRLIDDENLRTAYIKKGFAKVSEFNWNTTAAKTWSVLEEVACN